MTGTGKATIETLQRLVAAFNAHDLDAVMGFFTDDPVLELPRGPHPLGQRFQGREAVRSGSAGSGAVRSGCSPGPLSRGSGSRSEAATCSSSRGTRSPARTPTGSSWRSDALAAYLAGPGDAGMDGGRDTV
jgi:hypothetical protein